MGNLLWRVCGCLVIPFLVIASGTARAADNIVWQGKGWTVSLTQNDTRAIGCHTYLDDEHGTRLVIALYRSAEWRASVGDHGQLKNLRPGAFRLVVDDSVVLEGRSEQFPGGGIRLGALPGKVVSAISHGSELEVLTSSGNRSLSLRGSSDAIAKVEQCVAMVFEAEHKARSPSYRVHAQVSEGVLNFRAAPSSQSSLVASVRAGTPGLRPSGACRPSEDPLSSVTWCQFTLGTQVGWASMLGLVEEQGNSGATPNISLATPTVSAAPTPMPPPTPAVPSAPSRDAEPTSGTAFFITNTGHLLTNAHVVKGCRSISISQPGKTEAHDAAVLATDSVNDLALLRTKAPQSAHAALRRQVKLGEDIAVFGYPLAGLISSTGNFTRGSVSALAGLGDDTTNLQLTAAVQPGNSGGPVLDQYGNVVAVVVGKLNAALMMKATGNVPDQINFAIKVGTVQNFLEANQVDVSKQPATEKAISWTDVADIAKSFTVLVDCKR